MADIRDQLLAAFKVEYREHVDAIRAGLRQVAAGEGVQLREMFRRAHSLKGAARAVDLPAVESAAHDIEERFARAMEAGAVEAADAAEIAVLLAAIERSADAVYGAQTPTNGTVAEDLPTDVLRVNAGQIRRLSTSMHELSSDLEMLDGDAVRLRDLHARALGLAQQLDLGGGAMDTARLAQEARAVARELSVAARGQKDAVRSAKLSAGRMRDEVERVALAPASTVFAGLEAMVSDLAQEAGKQVNVTIEGLETQADRVLLQSLRDPVIHLLRNAVAHGVGAPAARIAAGKPETGEVGLRLTTRAGRLEITVYDDGKGPDLPNIEATAIARGLLTQRAEAEPAPSPDRLLALVFEPGFSTAGSVSRISGRGMGLSVVAEAARRAGGGAFMRRRRPYGAEVVISTPLFAARQTVLIAHEAGQMYGIPTRALESVIRARESDLETVDGRQTVKVRVDGNQIVVPVVSLGLVLGAGSGEESDTVSIAVLRQWDQRLGVRVDALADVREATVAALTHPDIDDLVQGAVQLEQDQVAIVINPEALMRRYSRNEHSLRSAPARGPRAVSPAAKTILVVDDSVTTRTLEKSILEASGYKVILAVDGVDALDRLRSHDGPIDLVVADVEMPRMDGFQLLGALKSDPRLAAVPVIMMTSRASPEDVRRGMELGADAYLVKQAFDQKELLGAVGQLL